MDEPDVFIVTVQCAAQNFETDMALPAGLPVREMRGKVLNVLKALDEEKFQGWQICRLQSGYRFLSDEETLARAGIFDGGRLNVTQQ